MSSLISIVDIPNRNYIALYMKNIPRSYGERGAIKVGKYADHARDTYLVQDVKSLLSPSWPGYSELITKEGAITLGQYGNTARENFKVSVDE